LLDVLRVRRIDFPADRWCVVTASKVIVEKESGSLRAAAVAAVDVLVLAAVLFASALALAAFAIAAPFAFAWGALSNRLQRRSRGGWTAVQPA
jgi:hypothetical protein